MKCVVKLWLQIKTDCNQSDHTDHECEISLPEMLSQSSPVLRDGCLVMLHPLASNIKCNIKY